MSLVAQPPQTGTVLPEAKPRTWVWQVVLLAGLVFYLLMPIVGLLRFSTRAANGITFQYYLNAFADPAFYKFLGNSLLAGFWTIAVTLILTTFTLYWAYLKARWLLPLLEFISLLPFVVPAVTLGVGLIQIFSTPPLRLTGTPYLLIGAYAVVTLPFAYRAIENSLQGANVLTLTEAAESLGASWWQIFVEIILPCVWSGVISGGLLVLSYVLGEFTLALFLVGSSFQTFPLYINQLYSYQPQYSVVMSLLSFVSTWLVAWLLVLFTQKAPSQT
ncbi:MAG: ABC transporter permease subunit [Leptolyngbyaceae cyanobacterium SL_5_9]|nr:ABC transporter permease subunit [Leptolyngbyaceae cyanobacterium SL_5_9]NJO76266.1 ABC transporter permease subunit [Leptolyngbyaceae cyanobacterium RM1_406_9]